MDATKLLFVCLGNICRSPSAEGVMQALVDGRKLSKRYGIDSAGTAAYHVGERADRRMRSHAAKRGYDLTSRARQCVASDLREFDHIFAQDDSNYHNILALDPSGEHHHKVHRMVEFCDHCPEGEVPDPYYGGAAGFERVLDILEESCGALLDQLEAGTL